MKRLLVFLLAFVFLFSNTLVYAEDTFQNGFSLEYHLYMEAEDHPRVEIKISGLKDTNIRFHFNNSMNLCIVQEQSNIFHRSGHFYATCY